MSDPVVHQVLFYDYVENAVERRAPYREEHQQIVIAYGTAAQMPKPIPATYDWEAAGL